MITKKMAVLFIVTLIFLTTSSLLADTCPNDLRAGDRNMWDTFTYMTETWYRDMFAGYYNLQKGDWDGGWGWAKYNDPDPDRYEFCKMMSAGRLLWAGLESELNLQGAWDSRAINASSAIDDPGNYKIEAVSRSSNTIDLISRDSLGRLLYISMEGDDWYPGEFPANTIIQFVSDLVATEKNSYKIAGKPALVNRNADSLDVFARNNGNELYHFSWEDGAGWSVMNLTALTVRSTPIGNIDRYFIYGNPIAVRRDVDSLDVFAKDNFNHLIHYYWFYGGSWAAEDLTQMLGGEFRVIEDPVVFRSPGGRIDIFGRNTHKQLLHFFGDSGGWQAENVSEIVGSSYAVDGPPSIVNPASDQLFLCYRSDYRLIAVLWTSQFGWWEIDLTNNTYPIDGDPVVISRKLNTVNIFAKGLNRELIHYYNSESGFEAEDLTHLLNAYGIVDTPAAYSMNTNRLDVFTRNLTGQFNQYHWTSEKGWEWRNAHYDPSVSDPSHRIQSAPIAVHRNSSSWDVFAIRESSNQFIIHYTSPNGLIVNSWHTNSEYSDWAAGSLHDFKYTAENSDDANASARRSSILSDRVAMKCPSFNDLTAAERAGTMLHEATHMIHWRWRHQDNLPGSSCSDPCSDNWFYHTLRDPDAELNPGEQNHSMNQLKIEYLCDIAEFARNDIPLNAFIGARAEANRYMQNRILNPPDWSCGVPRPLY